MKDCIKCMYKQFCTNTITRTNTCYWFLTCQNRKKRTSKLQTAFHFLQYPTLQAAGEASPLCRQQSERFGTQNSRIRWASSNSQDGQGYIDRDRLSFLAQGLWSQQCPYYIRWGTKPIMFHSFTQSLRTGESNLVHSRNRPLAATLLRQANFLLLKK